MDRSEIIKRLKEVRENYPDNIMAQTIDIGKMESLSDFEFDYISKIIRSGLDNPQSHVGAYAMTPSDYDDLGWLFDPILEKYHHVDSSFTQRNFWEIDGKFDLKNIDSQFDKVSMRVRVARSINGWPLPGSMSKEKRVEFEEEMQKVFEKLISKYGGEIYSLTPGSKYEISEEKYKELIGSHKMFKNMDNDPYLNSAGISGDWPHGRGMWESRDGNLIVWVNEEDHLRIISMKKGSDLSEIFVALRDLLDTFESVNGIKFAYSQRFGVVTSCPSNIGTGMRASIHIQLPNLVKDEPTMKQIAKSYGLSVRGLGGEHTAYGEDGTVDISPSARLGVTEAQILNNLFKGIAEMLKEESRTKAAV